METTKKIAMVGAMCAGKTTLLNHFLADERVMCIEDIARTYLLNNPGAIRSSIETCEELVSQYHKSTLLEDTNTKLLLTDGCPLTPSAHLMAYGKLKEADKLTTDFLSDSYSYSVFLLMNIDDIQYKQDLVRKETAEFRFSLQSAFESILNYYNLPYITVSGLLPERIKIVSSIIDSYR